MATTWVVELYRVGDMKGCRWKGGGGGVDGREMAGGGERDRSQQQGKLQPTVTAGMARSKGEIALRAETI